MTTDCKNCHSWDGDVTIANVNLWQSWRIGTSRALVALIKSSIFTRKELDCDLIQRQESGVCMLCPCHRTGGVLAGAHTLVDLSNVDNDNDVNVIVSLSPAPGAQPEATLTKEINMP